MKNNKAIMASVLEAVKAQFNVRARGIIEICQNEVYITVNVADVPQSVGKNIGNWVAKQGFELPVNVDTYATDAFQEKINAKCAEMDAQYTIESDRKCRYNKETETLSCNKIIVYNTIDQRQAAEAIWEEDQKGIKVVITPVFKNRMKKELQYA